MAMSGAQLARTKRDETTDLRGFAVTNGITNEALSLSYHSREGGNPF
jgi:hypothetical protein